MCTLLFVEYSNHEYFSGSKKSPSSLFLKIGTIRPKIPTAKKVFFKTIYKKIYLQSFIAVKTDEISLTDIKLSIALQGVVIFSRFT